MLRDASASQGAACTALHPLARRLAGRLLALGDRMGPGSPLGQAALAETLNARRPTVSTELQPLRRAGLIRHAHGWIAVADRPGLEALAWPSHPAAPAAGMANASATSRAQCSTASIVASPAVPLGRFSKAAESAASGVP